MQNSSLSSKKFLHRVTQITEANLSDEHFGVSELAWEMGISRSSLHRKIKKLTNNSASRFICRIRLEKALILLQQDTGSVSEIAYKVGFSSSTYFSKCFHDNFGISPLEAKNGNKKILTSKLQQDKKRKRKKLILILTPLILVLLFAAVTVYQSFHQVNTSEKWLMVINQDVVKTDENVTAVINSLQHEIRKNLNQLNHFNVVSESTSINYSNLGFDMKKLAKKGVDYVLLFQPVVLQDKITLYLELTNTHTRQTLLNEPYELNQISDNIFISMEEIAIAITSAVQEKISAKKDDELFDFSHNKAATYNFNLGLNYLNNYQYNGLENNLYQSKKYFEKAIEHDSTFAAAYTRLGFIYICLLHDLKENPKAANLLLDTGKVYLEKALTQNPKQSWAWSIKSNYYIKKGNPKAADEYLRYVYKYRTSDHEYYRYRLSHAMYNADYFQILDCFCQYNKLKPTDELVMPRTLKAVIWALSETGFTELARIYSKDLFSIEKDSAALLKRMRYIDMRENNFLTIEKSLVHELEFKRKDTNLLEQLISIKFLMGKHDETKKILNRINFKKSICNCNSETKLIYAFYNRGTQHEMELNSLLKEIIKQEKEKINCHLLKSLDGFSHVNLIAAYSITGDKKQAIKYMKLLNQKKTVACCALNKLKISPLFNNLRNDDEFKRLLNQMEYNFQSQQKQIEKLMNEYTKFSKKYFLSKFIKPFN